jgi:hypothetical protein
MVFDKNKIQIKHILEMEKEIEGWPSPDDILYFVCKRADAKDKEGEITFSDYIIQKKMESASADVIQSSLLELVKKGYIKKIRESDSKMTYQILINPYEK